MTSDRSAKKNEFYQIETNDPVKCNEDDKHDLLSQSECVNLVGKVDNWFKFFL